MRHWYNRDVDGRVAMMFESIRRYRYELEHPAPVFITIAREYGCGAYGIAQELADALSAVEPRERAWLVYDRLLVERVAGDLQIAARLVKEMTTEHRGALEEFLSSSILQIPPKEAIFRRVARVVRGVAWHGNAIIIGRGGGLLTRGMADGLHVSLVAPFEWRITQLMADRPDASSGRIRRELLRKDEERRRFYRKYFHADICDARLFDLTFNCSRLDRDVIRRLILSEVAGRKKRIVKREPALAT